MQADVIDGPDAIVRVYTDWRYLCARGGEATAFQSYDLAAACSAAHLARGEAPRIVIARR